MASSIWDRIESDFHNELALVRARFDAANPPPVEMDPATASIEALRRFQKANQSHLVGRFDAIKDLQVAFIGRPSESQIPEDNLPLRITGEGDRERAEWRGKHVRFMEVTTLSSSAKSARSHAADMSLAVVVSAAVDTWTNYLEETCRSAGMALGVNIRCCGVTLNAEHRRVVKRFRDPCSRWLVFLCLLELEQCDSNTTSPLRVYWSDAALRLGHGPSLPSPTSIHDAVGWHRTVEADPSMATGYSGLGRYLAGMTTYATTGAIPAYTPDTPWHYTIEPSPGLIFNCIGAVNKYARKQTPEDLVNHERAAEIIGKDASTIRRWISDGRLPSHGVKREVSQAELLRLLPTLEKRKSRTKGRRRP